MTYAQNPQENYSGNIIPGESGILGRLAHRVRQVMLDFHLQYEFEKNPIFDALDPRPKQNYRVAGVLYDYKGNAYVILQAIDSDDKVVCEGIKGTDPQYISCLIRNASRRKGINVSFPTEELSDRL